MLEFSGGNRGKSQKTEVFAFFLKSAGYILLCWWFWSVLIFSKWRLKVCKQNSTIRIIIKNVEYNMVRCGIYTVIGINIGILFLRQYFTAKWVRLKIFVLSFFYNDHLSSTYVADILMEPMLWFVDNFTHLLGPFFVGAVICLTISVAGICFWLGLPYWWQRDVATTVVLLIVGHWILVNVVFHYYMGCIVSPGLPPEGAFIPEAVSICKKCIAPKPPRTHHCSVCNKCVLKMDHHCRILFKRGANTTFSKQLKKKGQNMMKKS